MQLTWVPLAQILSWVAVKLLTGAESGDDSSGLGACMYFQEGSCTCGRWKALVSHWWLAAVYMYFFKGLLEWQLAYPIVSYPMEGVRRKPQGLLSFCLGGQTKCPFCHIFLFTSKSVQFWTPPLKGETLKIIPEHIFKPLHVPWKFLEIWKNN